MTTMVTCVTAQGSRTQLEVEALVTAERREQAREQANRWIKSLRLVPYDGTTMRGRFTYRGDSLWWFTELYLHKMRRLDTAVAVVLALDAARAEFDPARLIIQTSDTVVADTARAFGRARGLAVEISGSASSTSGEGSGYVTGLTARVPRLGARHGMRRGPTRVAAFVHSAFWRPSETGDGQESYIGPVLDALSARVDPKTLAYVGVGPRRNFRARRWWHPLTGTGWRRSRVIPVEALAPRRALADAIALWKQRKALARDVTAGDGIRRAALVEGCDLWPTLKRELERAALIQWPWSARVMDEAGAALDSLAPEVVLTYAEAGGWGRALMLEARRRGLPSVGIQHGFIYRHWLNYLHEPDEIQTQSADGGFPLPDRTLVFDRYAADHLETQAHFPTSAVRVTGSVRLDELADRITRLRRDGRPVRHELGVGDDQKLVVLAAKFSEIRHELRALFDAVAARPSICLIVKTHPAETPDLYSPFTSGVPNAVVAPADADLARLVGEADGLVTMNSTVALDCLVLGVPSLVLGGPGNLSPFVDAGVMLGASGPSTSGQLERLLYDRHAREELLARGVEFTSRYGMRADGQAAERAVNEILALTR
jgi:hypothetical protein